MDINKLINDFKEFDSATVQNAMILVRGYVDANIDYTSPDLKCYNFQNPVVGIAVTAKVTPLDEPKSKIDFNELMTTLASLVVLDTNNAFEFLKHFGESAALGNAPSF